MGEPAYGLVICNDYAIVLNHRMHILRHAVARGWRFDVMGGGDRSVLYGVAGMRAVPVRIERFSFHPIADAMLFLKVLWRLVTLRPQMVHTISLKPNLFGGLAVRLANFLPGRRVRLVGMSPGLGRLFEDNSDSFKARLRRRIVFTGLRAAFSPPHARIVFENHRDRGRWIEHGLVPESRAHVVKGTGISLTQFRPSPLGNDGRLRVALASRLLHAKGIAEYVEAARMLKREGHEVDMVLAGAIEVGDPDAVPEEEIEAARDAIDYAGHCNDMPGLLAGVHVVCLPTRYPEGIPRILLEGAATGCALIAADQPGCRMIVDDGGNGRLVEPDEAMARHVTDAIAELDHDRERLAKYRQASIAKVAQGGFSSEDIAAAYLAFFEGHAS
jgi:glycosyltransferase involved in cell wall biosynthesis